MPAAALFNFSKEIILFLKEYKKFFGSLPFFINLIFGFELLITKLSFGSPIIGNIDFEFLSPSINIF